VIVLLSVRRTLQLPSTNLPDILSYSNPLASIGVSDSKYAETVKSILDGGDEADIIGGKTGAA